MNRYLKILLGADFFILLAMGMIAPIYAIFVEEIGGSILDAGIAWAIFCLTSGILMYVIGRWSDKKKHYSRMLFFGYMLRSLAFLGYFFVQNTTHLFLVQILLGLSMAIATPSYDALYSEHLDKGRYATDWSLWESMNMITAAVAALVGSAIVNYFGFKTLFIIMFLSGVIGMIISSKLMLKSK